VLPKGPRVTAFDDSKLGGPSFEAKEFATLVFAAPGKALLQKAKILKWPLPKRPFFILLRKKN
jgi:hypothetical protein